MNITRNNVYNEKIVFRCKSRTLATRDVHLQINLYLLPNTLNTCRRAEAKDYPLS